MTRLDNRIENLEFNDIALEHGWSRAHVNNQAKRVSYIDSEDRSYLNIHFSKYLLTITRILWFDHATSRFNVWEPRADEEHISISRIKHILRGTLSPHTKT